MNKKKYLVKFLDQYLIETPNWNSGKWTKNKEEATRYGEEDAKDFFPKYYPQFEVLEDLNG